MEPSTVTAIVVTGSSEQRVERALEDWVCDHGNVCEIDTTNLISPRFIMLCDDIDRYRKAIDEFCALWVIFNDAGINEATFMSAFYIARKHAAEVNR